MSTTFLEEELPDFLHSKATRTVVRKHGD